jgi:pimeloyl-ACP methyl ester carboxylesterase
MGTLRSEGFEPLATDYPGTILKREAASPITWVFIESDGSAFGSWPTGKPSPPKVHQSVALSLARKVASDTVVYLARPCQFLFGTPSSGQCLDPRQWTKGRYSDDQVALIEDAIRQTLGAAKTDLIVVGHSGGGVIALRMAQRARLPIHCTITLASPIDIRAWQRHHQTSAALDITDPGDLADNPTRLKAIFLFGSSDQTVPPSAIGRWAKEARRGLSIHSITLAASHNSGWGDTLVLLDSVGCAPKRTSKP